MMKFQLLVSFWRIGLLLFVLGFGAPSALAEYMCIENVTVRPAGDITIDDPVVLVVSLYGERSCVFVHSGEVKILPNRVVVEIRVEQSDSDVDCGDRGSIARDIEVGKLPPGAYDYSVELIGSSACDVCRCLFAGGFSVSGGACCVDGRCQDVMQPECVRRGGIFTNGVGCSYLSCVEFVPAVSDWGMIALILLLGVGVTLSMKNNTRRDSTTISGSW